MTETKNNKAFYNNEIPGDWEVKKFESFAKFFSDGTPLTTKPEYYSGNIPFIKSGEIYFKKNAKSGSPKNKYQEDAYEVVLEKRISNKKWRKDNSHKETIESALQIARKN